MSGSNEAMRHNFPNVTQAGDVHLAIMGIFLSLGLEINTEFCLQGIALDI